MRNSRRTGAGLALAVAGLLLSCAEPFAGVNPIPATAVAPAASEKRLRGVVELNGQPLAGATMRAFDLATGRELPLIAAGGQNLIAAGGQNLIAAGGQNLIAAGGQNLIGAGGQNLTGNPGAPALRAGRQHLQQASAGNLSSASGRFDYMLPTTSDTQFVKLVAVKDGLTLVSLFDGAGNVVGEAPADLYRVQQTTVSLTVRVKLTAATTAAAKAFEGAFKLQFQLKEPSTQEGLKGLLTRVNRAVKALEQAFTQAPELARQLASGVNAQGELPSNAAFQAVIAQTGLLDELLGEVKAVLETFTSKDDEQERKTGLDAISGEDFPLGGVEIATSGEFTYTDADGTVVSGTVENANLVAEPSPSPAAPDPDATPGPTTPASQAPSRRRSTATPTPEPEVGATGTIDVNTGTESPGPPTLTPRLPPT
ncbi:MAG: hypothetical protein VKS61_09345 [Candidatus Sericytochromatia bacterium]|nr:hypothetical protein [Candidatus Sericytochromatia bacterium]